MSSFTDAETQEIKGRLGYGNLTANARPYFDIARVFEDIVQNFTDDYGIARVRTVILPQLRALDGGSTDATGGVLAHARTRYGIKELVGDVVFDTGGAGGGMNQFDSLLREIEYWTQQLESTLKVKRAPKLHRGSSCEVY